MEQIGALGMKHLTNILYREDELTNRTKLVFRWIKEKELTQEQFDELITYCNDKKIIVDKDRRNGKTSGTLY